MNYRVGVLEDEDLMRLTLVAALRAQGLEVCVEANSVADFLAQAGLQRLDAVLLDLHLGTGPTGIDAARALRTKDPKIGLVFLTSFEDPRLLSSSLPSVPQGSRYLTKQNIKNIDQLVHEIQASVNLAASDPTASQIAVLTDTQIETLRLIALGLSNSEIAKKRFVSEKSVEATIARISKTLSIGHQSSQNQRVNMARVYLRASGLEVKGDA
jgi:DNA-binding NarL/FixJ family response regulator